MSLAIPEFSDEEIATVQANLDHRWGAGKPALELIVASRNRIALLQRRGRAFLADPWPWHD